MAGAGSVGRGAAIGSFRAGPGRSVDRPILAPVAKSEEVGMLGVLIVIGIIVVLVLVVIGIYNGLVREAPACRRSTRPIDLVQLKRTMGPHPKSH